MARFGRSFPFNRWHGQAVTQALAVSKLILPDVAGNSGDIAAASSFSGAAIWNGSNRLLCIDVALLGVGVTVSAMTYGGATCTLVGVKNTLGTFGRVESWCIAQGDSGAPVTGSNTLAVTLSGSLEFAVLWNSYTGVNQASPIEAFNSSSGTNAGSATDASLVITPTTTGTWIHGALVVNDTAVTANQTSRNNVSGTLGSGGNEDNGAAVSPATATTLSYTGIGITATWAMAGYAIRPASAASIAYALACAVGSYALTGKAATLTYTPGGVSTHYTLTCAAGAYVLSGKTTTLVPLHHYTLACAAGSYLLTGQASSNAVGTAYSLACAAGSYALTGKTATLTYSPSGTTTRNYTLTCAAGAYVTTGQSTFLNYRSGLGSSHPIYPEWRRKGKR